MERREFIRMAGLSAFAMSSSGFRLTENNGITSTDCATSQDMLGPFFRPHAPFRNQISALRQMDEVPIKVIGKLIGADCQTPLADTVIDIWHCDYNKNYDMDSTDYTCRGKIKTNASGEYFFNTYIPPPYGGRPKHIHYLIDEVEGFQSLATQLYFKGDKKIKSGNWVKYPWDEKRILEVYKNEEGEAEVNLDLYLKAI